MTKAKRNELKRMAREKSAELNVDTIKKVTFTAGTKIMVAFIGLNENVDKLSSKVGQAVRVLTISKVNSNGFEI